MMKNRPKVAVVVVSYRPYPGGERVAFETTERLAASGRYEVHVFAHKFGKDVHPAIHRHTIPRFPFTYTGKVLSYTWMAMQMARRDRFDVIHTHDRMPNQDVATLHGGCHAAYLDSMLAAMTDPHQRERERRKIRHRLTFAIQTRQFAPGHYHTLLAVSEMVRQEAIRLYNVPASKVRVTYNGVNLDEFSPTHRALLGEALRAEFGLQEREVVGLFVGSGYARKGVQELITALAQSGGDARRLRVLIVGRGNVKRYQALAGERGIVDRVIFAGERHDIDRFYAAADFFCLPTYYDPCSLVVLEALASGLPVVTTRSNGASEFITPGENGYVISHATDTAALGQALETLSDKATCQRMGHAARPAVEGYSWEHMVEQHVKVYEEVIAWKRSVNVEN